MTSGRLSRVLLGVACIGSGVAICVRPRAMADLYGLPRSRPLAVALGLRDALIGAGLLSGARPALWWRARVASDVVDSGLIAGAGVLGRKPAAATSLRVGVAWSMAAFARRQAHRRPSDAPQSVPSQSSRLNTAGAG